MTTPPEPFTRRGQLGFLPGLEGVRGVAVLGILLFHADLDWLPGGFLGVSTFFTLSGFLITRLLVAEVETSGHIDFADFYARRARRILPAAFAALILVAAFGAFSADATQRVSLRADGFSALFYVANWWLIESGSEYASQLGSPSPIQHFWSLAIEEQFYLFFPWIALLALRRSAGRTRFAALLVGAIACSFVWTLWLEGSGASNSRLYYGSDTRCAELFAGSLLALFWKPIAELRAGWPRTGVAAAGVVAAAVSGLFWATSNPDDVSLYRGGLSIYALSSVGLLAAGMLPVGPVQGVLCLSPLRWLGRVSYGAYLYHWPIFLWLDAERTGLGVVALSLLRLALTGVVSELSVRLLEQPIRKGRALRGVQLGAAFALTGVGVAAVLVLATRNPPEAWPDFRDEEAVQTEEPGEQRVAKTEKPGEQRVAPAEAPRRVEPLRISFVGDSLALNLGEGLRRFGRSRRNTIIQVLAAKGCAIVRGHPDDPARDRSCERWRQSWGAHLAKFDPELVVVATVGWDVRDRRLQPDGELLPFFDPRVQGFVRSEYEAAVEFWSARGARVVLLTSPCLESSSGDRSGIFDVARTKRLNDATLRPLAEMDPTRVSLLDLYARVCSEDRVLHQIEGMQGVRPDGIHFSVEASVWLGAWMTPQLEAIAKDDRESASRRLAPSPPSPPSATRSSRRNRVR